MPATLPRLAPEAYMRSKMPVKKNLILAQTLRYKSSSIIRRVGGNLHLRSSGWPDDSSAIRLSCQPPTMKLRIFSQQVTSPSGIRILVCTYQCQFA